MICSWRERGGFQVPPIQVQLLERLGNISIEIAVLQSGFQPSSRLFSFLARAGGCWEEYFMEPW